MAVGSGISLANKSQLLFGFALAVILTAALAVPWNRIDALVSEFQIEEAHRIADAWLDEGDLLARAGGPPPVAGLDALARGEEMVRVTLVRVQEIPPGHEDAFLLSALERLRDSEAPEEITEIDRDHGAPISRLARAIRSGGPDAEHRPITAILLIDRNTQFAQGQLLRNRILILSAGLTGVLLAILAFYFILTKLIFSPVRKLRDTAQRVQGGDLSIRADIRTRDEFEHLSQAFNAMLDRLAESQAQLRAINASLDLRVDELAQVNIGLDESNRVKSEFVANVSHELRTPLNSIIGFAELLQELAHTEGNADPKRLRYLANIVTSGRELLEMINELLDMAKIEAGRMEVHLEAVSVSDLVEGLLRIMRPQAEQKRLNIEALIAQKVPVVETDPGKLQQILYNFLSNAVKFTPAEGQVTLSVDRVSLSDGKPAVRIAVADTGPGIPEDMHDVIFEKFRQLDASHTRQQGGTGLGLAICKELAHMLGAHVSFVSVPGRGATFFVDVPLAFRTQEPRALME